jgi:hypothetical protein
MVLRKLVRARRGRRIGAPDLSRTMASRTSSSETGAEVLAPSDVAQGMIDGRARGIPP